MQKAQCKLISKCSSPLESSQLIETFTARNVKDSEGNKVIPIERIYGKELFYSNHSRSLIALIFFIYLPYHSSPDGDIHR